MAKLPPIEVIQSYERLRALQVDAIQALAEPGRALEILEAGCGRKWQLKLPDTRYRLTGIDMDAKALQHRITVQKDLDEGIEGDLRTHDFQDRQFDVIYSAFVLEHIVDAESVMRRFTTWLRPGGLMILAIPDPDSVQGFVTRVTPHGLHVFYYRKLYGSKDAGKPGFGPYKTYYERVVSRGGMREFCDRHGLTFQAEYGSLTGMPQQAWRKALIQTAAGTLGVLSFGKLASQHSNLLFILKKPS